MKWLTSVKARYPFLILPVLVLVSIISWYEAEAMSRYNTTILVMALVFNIIVLGFGIFMGREKSRHRQLNPYAEALLFCLRMVYGPLAAIMVVWMACLLLVLGFFAWQFWVSPLTFMMGYGFGCHTLAYRQHRSNGSAPTS